MIIVSGMEKWNVSRRESKDGMVGSRNSGDCDGLGNLDILGDR